MAAIITVNGKEFPAPQRGLSFIISTNVDSGRNANGEVIGQVVGRNINKANSLEWPWLDWKTWSEMLAEFDDFFVTMTIPNMRTGGWLTVKAYPGDRSAEPYWIDNDPDSDRYKLPKFYRNCKVNLIDCGIIGESTEG